MITACWVDENGHIGFGDRAPPNTMVIARAEDCRLRAVAAARASHMGETNKMVVPGISAARTETERHAAINIFAAQITRALGRPTLGAEPSVGSRVVVRSFDEQLGELEMDRRGALPAVIDLRQGATRRRPLGGGAHRRLHRARWRQERGMTTLAPTMSWPFGALTPLKYGAIIADPPWSIRMYGEGGYAKSPEAHYRTMSDEEIAALPVSQLASRDCLLVMWATWPKLPIAMRVMEAWGFAYKTGGSWTKTTSTGKRAFGTGYILRSATEPFLIGTIGRPGVADRSIRNLIETEMDGAAIESLRREHSRKPPEMREIVERISPQALCVELFGREPWPGHEVWGNEPDKFAGN
jgi:N6-adenosine-specific RNA methylase IME4